MPKPPPPTRYGFDPNDEVYETFYHGTSKKALEAIKKKGLTPGKKANYKESDPEAVYLANDRSGGERWAQNVSNYSNPPIVIEVRIPKSQLDRIEKDTRTMQSKKWTDYVHRGAIPREWISGYHYIDADGFDDFIELKPKK